MRRTNTEACRVALVAGLLSIGSLFGAACSAPATEQAPAATGVTVFEGARLIVGDGSAPIENAAFIVENDRFTQVGRAGELKVPAGAARVDLTGKTVMPAIIDTHTHLAVTREALVDQLQRKAYYGVGVAMSLGQDTGDVAFQVREETIPNAARLRTAGRGITMPEPGPHGGSVLDHERSRGPEGRAGARRQEGRPRQDLGRRPGRQVQEADAGAVWRDHR